MVSRKSGFAAGVAGIQAIAFAMPGGDEGSRARARNQQTARSAPNQMQPAGEPQETLFFSATARPPANKEVPQASTPPQRQRAAARSPYAEQGTRV